MQSSPPPAEDGAICASHPLIAAVFTCERCGSFGCESCRSTSSPTVCQPCFVRVAPFPRDGHFTVGALLADSFRLLPRSLPGIALLLGIELVGVLLFDLVPQLRADGALFLVSSCVLAFGTASFLSWTKAALLQEPECSLSSALLVGLRRFPNMLILQLFLNVAIGMGTMLFVLPGLYCALRLSVAAPLVVFEGHGAIEAFDASLQRTRKYWRKLLGVFAVVYALVFVSATVCGLLPSVLSGVGGSTGANLGMLIGTGVLTLGMALLHGTCLLVWMRLPEPLPSVR